MLEREEETIDSMTSTASSQRENLIGGYDCMSRNDLNSCTHQLNEIASLEQDLGHLPRSWQYHWLRVEVPPPVPPRRALKLPHYCFSFCIVKRCL